ncbi:hypothetical protein BBJ28_00020432 [Nothophytophthora sp. Chile5]|nr:hypothetical protein BBJ28_00020432 [Nothophytophthora sp. Chile5]
MSDTRELRNDIENAEQKAADRRRRNAEAVRRYRARQTPENRQRRRQQDRIWHRERRQHPSAPPTPTPARGRRSEPAVDAVDQLDVRSTAAWADGGAPQLRPVPLATKENVLERLRGALGASGLDETVCAVCDTWALRTHCRTIDVSDCEEMNEMRRLLSSRDENLLLPLVSEYDCSDLLPELEGILLSKRGVDRAGRGLHVCNQCGDSLRKREIPKFAMKNGFCIGSLPANLQQATLPERVMTQLVSVIAVTRVMRGGAHRAIRSHCLTFDATPGPPAVLLPTPMCGVSSYRVVMAGPFTTIQQAQIRKMHRVRRLMVDELLRFYRAHNSLYAHVAVDCSQLAEDQVPGDMLSEEPNAEIKAEDVDLEGSRVGGVSDNDATIAEDDVMERRVVFVSDDREVATGTERSATDDRTGSAESAHAAVELFSEASSAPQFLVRHSSRFSSRSKELFAQMFPHLFPYGRGHPGEARPVPVSLEACVRHYGMLSSRRFAEDELFMLVAFDHISLQKMYTQVALKCKRSPALFEPFSDVSEADLADALQQKELRRQGRTAAPRGERSSADRLLHSVELGGGAIWGSDAERAQCRRRAFAYQARYGQPALFVTLTPNVAESFVMAQYTGVSSVDTLFDAELAGAPGKSVMQSASLKNDVVSARLFMRNMDAFVEHVLGVHPAAMKGKSFDGLFGKVEAYFGMVETQGGGTLHSHFLVWLANAPPNSAAYDHAVQTHGEQYYRDLEAYTDSIVATSLPLDIAESHCQFCGESYADLKELPIPVEAYSSPNQRKGGQTAEPLLVQCGRCGRKASSQHVLRRVILDHRPVLWPPPRRDHSVDELRAAVAREVLCRGSTGAAKNAIFRRDCYLAGREADFDLDAEGDRLRSLNRAPQRDERFQDDLFRIDPVARAVLTLPPSFDDARWPSHVLDFAVSVLVFLLNLHWWSHVGSCFKKSRSAAPGTCRYGFPRPRVEQSTCTDEGVSVARRLACEYVNGFNAVMMAAFKSNHDIQVMVGGASALLRIYYATKYVTKMQAMIESVTAVALASFRRRQARELLDQCATADRASIGRRRVASLAFAVTNRREIAGPLAVLYLMRGSCCYMSSPCAPLPLKDILKELTHEDEHSCDLVALHDGDASVAVYRAASLLDDYCYRPRALDSVGLYEFVMWYFRRKRSQAVSATSLFLPAHPLSNTHCIGKHRADSVPVVTGVRMPYVDAESPSEMLAKRSRCALVLFYPFRVATDLVADPTNDAAWVDAYRRWEPTRSSFISQIMANLDDFHRVEKQAQEAAASEHDDLDVLGEDDDVTGNRHEVETMADGGEAACEDPSGDQFCLLFEGDDDACATEDELPVFLTSTRTGASSASSAVMYRPLLTPAAETAARAFGSLRQATAHEISAFTLDELNRYVQASSTDESEPSEHYQRERPTEVIELLSNALDPAAATWVSSDRQQQRAAVNHYATIAEVSRAFTLNQRQHAAFTIIATALLRTFLRQEQAGLELVTGASSGRSSQDFQVQLRDEQLLMFLGGAGGTGKSRVIDAINAFCVSWYRESSFMKTALTGKAATLIGARTLASFLVRIEHAIQEKSFATLDALVIDEVSMMAKTDWLKLDKLLRRYKQVPSVPFGGVHIILVGDFLQMPPVGADAIFVDPTAKQRPSTADIEGFELWRQFTTVVVLDESIRFRNDPEWGRGCAKARVGEWTQEFVDIINSRVVQPSDAEVELELALNAGVFVTPENATRLAINNAFVAQTATRLPPQAFPIRVVANFKGVLNKLSHSDVAYVLGLPDNRFGRMAPYLDLIAGMPIQVTQNVGTAKGVANGTLGTLDRVHFPREPPTTFRLVRDGTTGTVIQLPSHPPDYALLRLPRPRAVPIRAGLDAELFPVFFATEPFKKAKISLPPAPDGQRRYVEVKLQQFPFVCAVGSTVYKVQGETLDAMVVVDWTSRNHLINKPQQSYLLVSRVTSRNAFYSLTPFTPKLAKWSTPPQNTLDEEKRLNELSAHTLLAFQ